MPSPGVAVILVLAGLAAGVMNTVGGGGSVLTLPALILLGGVPEVAANATNRLGILVQNTTAIWRFRKGGVKEDGVALPLTVAALPGAAIGAYLAAYIDNETFRPMLAWIMLALLGLILFKPRPKLKKEADEVPANAFAAASRGRKAASLAAFFVLGLYFGFLQAGGGIMTLVVLGWFLTMDLVRGNYVKLVVILVTNALALVVFMWQGVPIYWIAGVLLFIGQIGGAYVGTWVALKGGETWIKVILAVSILASSGKLLGLY